MPDDFDESPFKPLPAGVYIDGSQFHAGLMSKQWGRYRWMDYASFAKRFVARATRHRHEVAFVKLYIHQAVHEPDTCARRDLYLRALDAHGGVDVVMSQSAIAEGGCQVCAAWVARSQQRRQLNLASDIVTDGQDDAFDLAVICSADHQLVPSLQFLKVYCEKQLLLLDPPGQHSNPLYAAVDGHRFMQRAWLNQAQLPNSVIATHESGEKHKLARPPEWAPPAEPKAANGPAADPDESAPG